ncbi:MAG: DUF6950 family protein [Gemmobacter sp.]
MVTALALRLMDGPFVWGQADCCTAACDVFAALTGTDPMAPLRGRYSTERGALRIIRRAGGWHALIDALAAGAGLARCAPAAGALTLVRTQAGLALGVVIESGMIAAKAADGAAILPADHGIGPCRR